VKQLLTVLAGALALANAVHGQTPTVTAVLDAGGYSSNVAQGSIFVVKGTNLSASGYNPAPGLPLGTTLANVKITFTPIRPGPSTDAYMVYTYNVGGVNQLAGLVPSAVAAGDYNVTVTNNGAVSANFKTTVVGRKFGIITQDGSGSGNAVVQNFISATQLDVDRLTTGTLAGSTITHSPSHPGQVIIIWGTGLGGVLGVADNVAPGAQDFRSQVNVTVLVGGQPITPDYAGRAPSFPGEDQINLTLPSNVATGCTVSLQVSVAGQLSNPATIAIAAPGSSACVSPVYSQDVLTRLDQGGTISTGVFALTSLTTRISIAGLTVGATIEAAAGAFSKLSGAQLATAASFQNAPGSCQIFRRVGDQTSILLGTTSTNLDAGSAITLSGPNVVATANQLARGDDKSYSLSLGTAVSGIPFPPFNPAPIITDGTYRLAGTGGADVGAFNASVTIGPRITVTPDLPGTINRGVPLTVAWTGGSPTDIVNVVGFSGVTVGGTSSSPVYDAGVFICTATASQGRVVVPAFVLSQLPITPPGGLVAGTGIGAITVLSTSTPSQSSGIFTAPLTAGGTVDTGLFLAAVGYLTNTEYQ
jgi:uncharacterized protein (TIGR03437 family)